MPNSDVAAESFTRLIASVGDIPKAFDARRLFEALATYEVEYVTIGGIAIQAHGGQRLTQDLEPTKFRSAI